MWGRSKELAVLGRLKKKSSASLVVIKGRRRIGKSYLIHEFSKLTTKRFYIFTGLAPRQGQINQDQIDNFRNQLVGYLGAKQKRDLDIRPLTDWNQAFLALSTLVHDNEQTIILLDEISWMGSHDSDFAGKLKIAWDNLFSGKKKLILFLCGSVSTWIQKNILESSNFLGRISTNLTLQEVPLYTVNQFWGDQSKAMSDFEKTKILCVTGLVPKYLDEVVKSQSANDNINSLCFEPSGFLYNEFDHIFSDIFGRRAKTYKKIVMQLVQGRKTASQLAKQLKIELAGNLLQSLSDLELSGFIQRDYSFSFGEVKSRISTYRLKDNYLRFALKYLSQHTRTATGTRQPQERFEDKQHWRSLLGLQFENLVLNHKMEIIEALGIREANVLSAEPFVQRESTRNKGNCQVDLVIQTKERVAYICEIKLRERIDKAVIKEVKDKMAKLTTKRLWSLLPILIYEGELNENDRDEIESYFSTVLRVGELYGQSSSQ